LIKYTRLELTSKRLSTTPAIEFSADELSSPESRTLYRVENRSISKFTEWREYLPQIWQLGRNDKQKSREYRIRKINNDRRNLVTLKSL